MLAEAEGGCIAEVVGDTDIDDAIDTLRTSLDALRLFQLSTRATRTTMFGLPGEVRRSRVNYVAVWERSAHGGRFLGHGSGWPFSEAARQEWNDSDAFGFLDAALAQPDRSEGARRAVVGTQLLGRAALETRSDLKILGVVAALEAWLLRREQSAQTMRLARHAAWFGCGRHSDDLCGRDRPICPYLHLNPSLGADRKRLGVLRDLGNSHLIWRCSEWRQVMDWYDARSGAAHGDPTAVDHKRAEEAEYWVAHFLAEPILLWLRDHSVNPVADLEAELDAVADPANWSRMVGALDADHPPPSPPVP